jgi:hypothetical protein
VRACVHHQHFVVVVFFFMLLVLVFAPSLLLPRSLADAAEFLLWLKDQYQAPKSPIITFGCSYPGTFAENAPPSPLCRAKCTETA